MCNSSKNIIVGVASQTLRGATRVLAIAAPPPLIKQICRYFQLTISTLHLRCQNALSPVVRICSVNICNLTVSLILKRISVCLIFYLCVWFHITCFREKKRHMQQIYWLHLPHADSVHQYMDFIDFCFPLVSVFWNIQYQFRIIPKILRYSISCIVFTVEKSRKKGRKISAGLKQKYRSNSNSISSNQMINDDKKK